MIGNRIMMTCSDEGITRAVEVTSEEWVVEKLLTEARVTCLTTDPTNSDIVYAGTRESGVWRSEDQGKSWKQHGLQDQQIKSLAVSPHDPKIIYAGTKPALMFLSSDGANTWQELDGFRNIRNRWWWWSPADQPGWQAYVTAIAPSPTDPEVLLAGIEFGAVVLSEDGGQTWSPHISGTLRDCHTLHFHNSNGNYAYEAGGSGGGASISRDGGRTWQKSNDGFAKSYGITSASDPLDPNIWYTCLGSGPANSASENPRIYLYRSNGQGWHPIGWEPHPLSELPTVLVTSPEAPGQLYAGLSRGDVMHSVDYGDTWNRLPFNLGAIWHGLIVLDV